jgi:hypothetical protein
MSLYHTWTSVGNLSASNWYNNVSHCNGQVCWLYIRNINGSNQRKRGEFSSQPFASHGVKAVNLNQWTQCLLLVVAMVMFQVKLCTTHTIYPCVTDGYRSGVKKICEDIHRVIEGKGINLYSPKHLHRYTSNGDLINPWNKVTKVNRLLKMGCKETKTIL